MARHRVRHHATRVYHAAKRAGAGARGSAMTAGAGAAAFFAAEFANQHVKMLSSHYLATPAALAVGGHFLKRKYPTLGAGMLGAAGWSAAANYRIYQAQTALAAGAKGLQWNDAAALESAYGRTGEGAPDEGAPSADNAGALKGADEGLQLLEDVGELESDALYLAQ